MKSIFEVLDKYMFFVKYTLVLKTCPASCLDITNLVSKTMEIY